MRTGLTAHIAFLFFPLISVCRLGHLCECSFVRILAHAEYCKKCNVASYRNMSFQAVIN